MKKTTHENTGLVSLNDELHTEFAIQELEQRLETDPLMFVDFFQQDLMADGDCILPGSLVVCNHTFNLCSNPEALVTNPN